jgi:uncharacterized membrane protein YczE
VTATLDAAAPTLSTRTLWVIYSACVATLMIGAAALVRSELGADPYGAFVASFTRWGITPGVTAATFAVIAIAACWALGTRARAGTYAAIAAGPLLFDTAWRLLDGWTGPATWALGFTLLTIGAAGAAATGLGPGAPEHVAFAAAERGITLRSAIWARDAAFIVAAWALGGPIGAGTIVAVLAISPAFAASYRLWARILGAGASPARPG